MIQPGLERISRLLAHTPLTWKVIHVAGTNGKGSICAAVSGMLKSNGVRCGRFTSPHLIDRWDCINIDERPVNQQLFQQVENDVLRFNKEQDIKASEFELLTATAFRIFNREKLEFAVVEVGMGGLLDATNVITQPSVTVISKISLDHQSFLGNTIEEIAFQKAGIIKRGVPCIVDGNNAPSVLQVIRDKAKELDALVIIRKSLPRYNSDNILWTKFNERPYRPHQNTNLGLAYQAVVTAAESVQRKPPSPAILGALKADHWPGRTQNISLERLTGRKSAVFLDGAHNTDSAKVLKDFVPTEQPVTWLIGMSAGKNAQEILGSLLKNGDSVVTVQFGPVDSMPWVKAMSTGDLSAAAKDVASLKEVHQKGNDVQSAIELAVKLANEGPLIITGSLYLISDVLRLRRDHSGESESQEDASIFDVKTCSSDTQTWQWE